MEMPKTPEELASFVDERIESHKAQRNSPEVRAFNQELHAWAEKEVPGDRDYETQKKRRNLVDGFKAALKVKLNLKTINSLTEDQVPEARKLFEQYKQLLTMD